MMRRLICGLAAVVTAVTMACSGNPITGPGAGKGMLAVKLTDAPLPLDSVAAVHVFVVRVDARRARADRDSVAETDIDHEPGDNEGWGWGHADSTKWVTIATPNQAYNLLDLHDGVTAFLGQTAIDTGHFRAIRLVIDPAQSTIVMKDGTVLSATSDPPVEFENRGRHALLVEFDESVDVNDGATTTIVLDMKLGSSISLRGRTFRDGFLFRPVVVGHCEHNH